VVLCKLALFLTLVQAPVDPTASAEGAEAKSLIEECVVVESVSARRCSGNAYVRHCKLQDAGPAVRRDPTQSPVDSTSSGHCLSNGLRAPLRC
jgi:hypothetical protein